MAPSTALHTAVRLDLILMDGALERIDCARSEAGDMDRRGSGPLLDAAVLLMDELRSSLGHRGGDPFAVNLDDLCHYVSRQLLAANSRAPAAGGTATLDEMSHLLREARQAWATLSYV